MIKKKDLVHKYLSEYSEVSPEDSGEYLDSVWYLILALSVGVATACKYYYICQSLYTITTTG